MPKCPTCDLLLVHRNRCPRCRPGAVAYSGEGLLDDILDGLCYEEPLYAEGIELSNRLKEIAPAFALWRSSAEHPGPPPDVHPRYRAEVERIDLRLKVIADEIDRLQASADPNG